MSTDLPPIEPRDPAPPPAPAPRSPGWMRALLIGSLAVNLAVLGVIGGVALNGGPKGPRGGPGGQGLENVRDIGLGQLGSVFAPEDRKAIRSALKDKRPEMRSLRRDLRGTFTDLLPLLRAETFDADAANALLDGQRRTATEIHTLAHNVVSAHIATMSYEDRVALADRMEERLKRRPKKPKNGPRKQD